MYVNNEIEDYVYDALRPTDSNIFLDTMSKIVNGNVELGLHTKPTYSHLYLMLSSCHPSHTLQGVPKGLTTRVRHICSTPALYK
jgi:hypothetical protein